jgi:hypothetical protein
LLREDEAFIITKQINQPTSSSCEITRHVDILVEEIISSKEPFRCIKKKTIVLGTIVGQLKAFKQGKTIFVIKRQQQAKLLSQHHLERVSTLEKNFKEKKKGMKSSFTNWGNWKCTSAL